MVPQRKHSEHPAESPAAAVILGTKVDSFDQTQTLDHVLGMLEGTGRHTVYPVNPEMIMRAQNDPPFREVLNRASIGTADGVGIILAARLLGFPIRERVAGIDLALAVLEKAAATGIPVFLLGAADGVAEKAAGTLSARFPGLRVVGTYAGSPSVEEEEAICALVRDSGAVLLMVAYGAPKQELWIDRNLARTGVRVAMAVGGSLDFIAGVRKRAPKLMQNAGIEWAYRLVQEPRRWKRMLALPRFALAVLRQRMTRGRHRVATT